MRFSLAHKPVILLTLLSLLVSVFSAPVSVQAQDAPPPIPKVLQVSAQAQVYHAERNVVRAWRVEPGEGCGGASRDRALKPARRKAGR